jgi:hypothetical protein
MGFKLVEVVYGLDRNATTPTEQSVLLALAFRANDKTLLCYPKQDTIAEMTHLHRVTVSQCLNSLRQKGILDWKSGGLRNKRGKYGQPLANDYRLNLSTSRNKGRVQGVDSVAHDYTAVLPTATRQCSPGLHNGVAHGYTAELPTATPTEETTANSSDLTTPIPNRGGSEPVFDEVLKTMGVGVPRLKPRLQRVCASREDSPLMMALDLCGLSSGTDAYRDNYRAFSSVMVKLGMERSMEVVRMVASEMRAGEMDNVRNLAALLMTRLQQEIRNSDG